MYIHRFDNGMIMMFETFQVFEFQYKQHFCHHINEIE